MSCFCFFRMYLKFVTSSSGSFCSSNSLMSLYSLNSMSLSRYFRSISSLMKVFIAFEKTPMALIAEIS